jgi:hypothetical protein
VVDRECVTEYVRNQPFLEAFIIFWILSMLAEFLRRLRRRQMLVRGIYGKSTSLFSVLGVWDLLDVLAVFFTLSAAATACQ